MQLVLGVERNKTLQSVEAMIQKEGSDLIEYFYIDDCIDSRWVYKDSDYVSLIIRRTIEAINDLSKAAGENNAISIRHRD